MSGIEKDYLLYMIIICFILLFFKDGIRGMIVCVIYFSVKIYKVRAYNKKLREDEVQRSDNEEL